jgi:DNA-directed RNA polymerase beta' subunit
MNIKSTFSPKKWTKLSNIPLFETTAMHSSMQNLHVPNIESGQNLSMKQNKTVCKSFKKPTGIYTSYSKLSEVKLLTIGIASPLRILQWAEKTLPNGHIYGEVLNANTLHHKNFKPQKGGLFCERIFGPLKDFECACGKIDKSVKQELSNALFKNSPEMNDMTHLQKAQQIKNDEKSLVVSSASSGVLDKAEGLEGPTPTNLTTPNDSKNIASTSPKRIQIRKFCPDCDVEYTWSVIRRYQLGYIKLISPVTHLWFLKGTPSYLSLLLDIKKRHLQFVTYCSETFTLENSLSQNTKSSLMDSPSKIVESWKNLVVSTPSLPLVPLRGKTPGGVQTTNTLRGTPTAPLSLNAFSPLATAARKKEDTGEAKGSKNQKRIFKEAMPNKDWKNNSQFVKLNGHETRQPMPFTFVSTSQENLLKTYLKDFSTLYKQDYVPLAEVVNENFNAMYLKNLDTQSTPNVFKKDLFLMKERIHKTRQMNILDFNTQNAGTIKNAFTLTTILNALQVSVYYKSLSDSKTNQNSTHNDTHLPSYPFNSVENHSLVNRSSFNLTFFKQGEKLDAMLYKVSQKLPIESYILCTLEQKMQKKAFLLAVNTTWDLMYKKAYIYALKKVTKSQSTYFPLSSAAQKKATGQASKMNSPIALNLEPILNTTENSQTHRFAVLTQSEAFFPVLNQSKLIQKNMAYKIGQDKLKSVLKNLKRKYSQYVFNTLKQNKHLLFSMNYTTLSQHDTNQIVAKVASNIEEVLLNSGTWVQKLLCQSMLKYLLFGTYLETMDFSNIKTVLNYFDTLLTDNSNDSSESNQSFKTTSVLSKYAYYLEMKNGQKSEQGIVTKGSYRLPLVATALRSGEPKGSGQVQDSLMSFTSFLTKGMNKENRTLPLEKPLKRVVTPDNNRYKEKQKIFNTVYSLSHRERWETEKDWYIFSLFNSATVEYLDTPIVAYKKRLFSYSFDFMNASEETIKSLALPKKSLHVQEVIYSNSFYSGPGIVKQLLNEFDFNEIKKLDKQNRLLLYQLNKVIFKLKKQVQVFIYDKLSKNELKELCKKRDLLIRRTKLVRKLFRKNSDPSSMILTVLPVLPPDLRPIVKMGGQIAASDLNRLYQRVIYRNERLKKFLKDPATSQSYEMKYAQRLLQESVDNLIQNGKSGMNSEKDARGRALKSLSDSLKGKQGRFRQFLLGKRVDYSGRSVIVVGPKLKLHECGLPIEMAKELYLPFLLKMILNKNYAKTVIGAKALMRKNPALTSELLREIMQVSPVLLNRAPTLHRLGFQAFVPKLIEGRAILLHPLVCSAFNADFDGDQMAVHVPITIEARAEAWKLMLSRNNILSPATGEPLAIPSQDMVLGCYYLTTYANKGTIPLLNGSGVFFQNFEDVIRAYSQQKISVHALVWVKWAGLIENGSDQEEPVEIRLSSNGQWQEISANYYRIYNTNNVAVTQYIATTPGRILFNSFITNNMK